MWLHWAVLMGKEVEEVKKLREDHNSSYRLQLLYIALSQTSKSTSSLVMAGPFRIYRFRGKLGFSSGRYVWLRYILSIFFQLCWGRWDPLNYVANRQDSCLKNSVFRLWISPTPALRYFTSAEQALPNNYSRIANLAKHLACASWSVKSRSRSWYREPLPVHPPKHSQ